MSSEQLSIKPSVLYFGTPVVLIVTRNPDATANIRPISSAWALDDRMVLGLGAVGQGITNLTRERECTLNLPSADLWHKVERIARTTGLNLVPAVKIAAGYVHSPDKFALGGFSTAASETVRTPRIAECPVQLEARLLASYPSGNASADEGPSYLIVEAEVQHVHAHRDMVIPGTDYIDTDRWNPLFYVFRHYFGNAHDLGKNFRAEQ